MMSKLNDIESQIARLQREAAELRQQELDIAISKVKDLVQKHGLTAEMIGLAGKRGGARTKKAAAAGGAAPSTPKYRDPKSGKTWTGKGKPPLWIAKARDRSRFLIDKPETELAAPAEAPKAAKPARGGAKEAAAPAVKKATKAAVKANAKAAAPKKAVVVKKAAAKAAQPPAPKAAKAAAKKTAAKKPTAKKAATAKSADTGAAAAAPEGNAGA